MSRWGWLYAVALAAASLTVESQEYRERLPQDEVIYFLLPDRFANGDPANDRGGLRGGPLQTGFDPAAKGFFHGGDLRGVLGQLDYIQQLGATAIWLAPIFMNERVAEPALRRGRQITRSASTVPGLFAVSRIDPGSGREVLVAFNTSDNPVSAQVRVNVSSQRFASLHGQCQPEVTAPGIYSVTVPPLGYILCGARE
jgi:glycosidase